MTEEEWKAFDKAKGTTVYVKQQNDRPVAWQIESTWPRGATLSRVYRENSRYSDDQKHFTPEPYQRIMTEEEGIKALRIWEENRDKRKEQIAKWKAEGRICPICGKKFKPRLSSQKTCSVECRKAKQRAEYYKPREPKVCVVCGKQFIPVTPNQISCSDACKKKRKANKDRENAKYYKEQRERKAEEQKND